MELNFKQRLTKITTLMFDVDGVMNNGKLLVAENGDVTRSMNLKDGYALYVATAKGFRVVAISGGDVSAVKNVLARSRITDVFILQRDKLACYVDYIQKHNLKDEEVMYMGHDLPDIAVMKRAGIAACPNDAATEIKEISQYISPKGGGEGCVRDIIEQVLRSQEKWEALNW